MIPINLSCKKNKLNDVSYKCETCNKVLDIHSRANY